MSQQQAFTNVARSILPALAASNASSVSILDSTDELDGNNNTSSTSNPAGRHLQSSYVPSFSQITSFHASQIPLGSSIPSLSGSTVGGAGDGARRSAQQDHSVTAVAEIRDDAYLKIGRSMTQMENGFSSAIKRERHDRDILEEYTCSICLDTIVGAAVLDCASGGGHTFCSECVETLMKSQQQQIILRELNETSHRISRKCHKCPNCGDSFTKAVPCRALDAAILDAVDRSRELDESDKEEFYARLTLWKEYVKRRNWQEQEAHRRNANDDLISRVGDYLGSFRIATVAGAAALSMLVLAMSLVKRN